MKHIAVFFLIVILVTPLKGLHAQERQALSVTPTLFQIAVEPGDVWQSYIKVINSNPYELTVYANVMNFEAQGEEGHSRFLPVVEEVSEATLGGWITLAGDPIVVPPEESAEVPFIVSVPENASPGGHFAAIMIGTRPPAESTGPLSVQVAQVVTSLFFVRVGGEIVESGDIREFSVAKTFTETPQAEFSLRFENKGNVHLQPQGDITIFNMWGKERGYIPINQKTNFGNALPESIRKFEFTWQGESSISDIGRYKAVVTLAYGQDARQFASRIVYFYVLPVKAALVTLGVILGFFFFITWVIKLYIRRAITLAGYEPPVAERRGVGVKEESKKSAPAPKVKKLKGLSAPLRAGVVDLRKRISGKISLGERMYGAFGFMRTYWLFFVSAFVIIGGLVGGGVYLTDALSSQKGYEVTVEKPDGALTISSEEVIKDRLTDDVPQQNTESDERTQPFSLVLVNAGDVPGTAAELAVRLEDMGYVVDGISIDLDRAQDRTVIVYDQDAAAAAVRLSEQLGNVLISATVTTGSSTPPDVPEIRIIVGRDQSE